MTLAPLMVILASLLGPRYWAHSCGPPPEVLRQSILDRVRDQVLDALGPTPEAWEGERPPPRAINKRHDADKQTPRSWGSDSGTEDTSQAILFPTTDVPCDPAQKNPLTPDQANLFTYLFQPSPHILGRLVTSAQLWFFTGTASPTNSSLNLTGPPAEVLVLTAHGHISLATTWVQMSNEWTVFHFAKPFLHYIAQKIFVLLVQCSSCPCISEADKLPFIVSTTRPRPQDRARRSSVPWSPAAVNLLQRPSGDAASHAHCHRGSVNITFEELGWDKWIVYPQSFLFHYCYGTCPEALSLTHKMGFQLCCAALPGTMRSLRVRTTSDGGFSFKYETVPNIITEDCVCI